MNLWQRGMAALGLTKNPEKLFRTSRFVRDSNGNQSLYFMVNNESDIPALIKMFESHGVTMTPYKSSIDQYKVLKITSEDIHKLPRDVKFWLLDLHGDIKAIADDRMPGIPPKIKSAIKDTVSVTDRNGKRALYIMAKSADDLDAVEKYMANNGIKLVRYETELNKSPETVLKITYSEIEKLTPDVREFLFKVTASQKPTITPDKQR